MHVSRVAVGASLVALALLTGCASKIFGPTSADRSAASKQATSSEASASGDVLSAASSSVKSSSSSSSARPEFEPEIIDIINVFQQKLTDTSDGFDTETVVSGVSGLGQLMLVTKGLKLNRHPYQNRIFYVISGHGDVELDGSGSSIRAGHIVAVPAGVSFKITPSGEQPLRLLLFKAPGEGRNKVEWLKESSSEEDLPPEPEPEVDVLQPIEEEPMGVMSSESSSEEEFQTGTLN